MCGKQSITGTGFSLKTLVFSCQYHSNTAPHSFIYHKYQLYNLNNLGAFISLCYHLSSGQ